MKKYLIIILTLILTTVTWSFHISPDGFGRRIDEGGFQEYTLKNNTGKVIRYRFKILPGNSDKTMHEWIEFEPKVMTIKDGESKKLKLFAKSPPNTPVGLYWFFLGIETIVLPPDLPEVHEEESTFAGSAVGININIEMGGLVGDLPAQLKLEKYEFYEKDGVVRMKGLVNNVTPLRAVRYMIEITDNSGVRENFYGGVINAKTTRNIDIPLPKFKKKGSIWKIEVRETLDRNLLQTINL